MVIIHPFHCISEDARHCSALSYLQVADRDFRVPEVIGVGNRINGRLRLGLKTVILGMNDLEWKDAE